MPNTNFQFKQFTIHQDQCAMKVSTDACILGAWVPDIKPDRILDIGTGTGLIALMLAQRTDGAIDAIELDKNAAAQARQNTTASPWSERITVIDDNIFDYAGEAGHKYDLIVSNPPFFTNSLKAEAGQKNLAKHDTADFSKVKLAMILETLLSARGEAFILYPALETNQFKEEAESIGLCCWPALNIRNQLNGPIFRVISRITRYQEAIEADEINIREGQVYSRAFTDLMQAYYLKY